MEVLCPQCGQILEIFVKMGGAPGQTGTLVTSERCECGFLLREGSYTSDYEKA